MIALQGYFLSFFLFHCAWVLIFLLCVKKAGELKWSVNCIHAELGLGRLVKGHSCGLCGFPLVRREECLRRESHGLLWPS